MHGGEPAARDAAAAGGERNLSELVQEHMLVDGYDEEEAFDFGLEIVLEGLERRLAEQAG